MCESNPLHNSNVTHASRNNYQVTFTFMENQGNSLNNNIHSCSSKSDYTNKFSRRIMAMGHYLLGRPWGVGLGNLEK